MRRTTVSSCVAQTTRDDTTMQVRLASKADLDRVRAGVFTYDFAIEAPPDGAKIAIAVVDQVARTHGIVRLDVPVR